jgi:hypothetical protein
MRRATSAELLVATVLLFGCGADERALGERSGIVSQASILDESSKKV